ncbi:MAG: M20/M25/M40 family metallo-hydrolase [Cyanobacteria bacterium P01_F01_bin.150]
MSHPSSLFRNNCEPHDQFASVKQNLLTHLRAVVRERDPYLATGGHFLVREYIREQLAQWGTVEVHEFQWRNNTHQNLILKLSSTESNTSKPNTSKAPILLGAHYDGVVGSPGADDNGTGVAVLLEMARQFAQQPIPKQDVWLAAFDLEEYGLIGSRAYAEELKRQNQSLTLMFSLEMLGYCDRTPGSQRYPSILRWFYPKQGDFIALVGNVKMLPELCFMTSKMRQFGVPTEWLPAGLKGNLVPETRFSDHAPFWDQGYKALMVTDTSFLRNPHYHKDSDRIDTLDMDFLTHVCMGLEHTIRQL